MFNKPVLILLVSLFTLTACGKIPTDKKYHIAGGAVVAGAAKGLGFSDKKACLASMAVGVAKEVYDAQHPDKHSVEFLDVVATAAVCIPLYLNSRVVHKNKPIGDVHKKPKGKVIQTF